MVQKSPKTLLRIISMVTYFTQISNILILDMSSAKLSRRLQIQFAIQHILIALDRTEMDYIEQ